jgi:uncharacterized membrane protein YvbJ
MRFAGIRVNLMWLAAAVAVVLVAIFFFAGRGSPTATAEEFMTALGHGDDAKLTELTYIRTGDKDAMEKAYEFATNEAGKNYSFLWRIRDERQADANTASVQISVMRNARNPTSYEENFEIPLVRKDGKWLVDVAGINDLMYPALPR